MPLLRWNTLDDAASSLSELTGEAWSPRRILSEVLDIYCVSQGKRAPRTCLRCAPPHDTKFSRYAWDAERGTPGNPFVYVSEAPYQTVPLYPKQVDDLLKTGATLVAVAERPEDDYGRAGEYVFVEPMKRALTVGIASVGMRAADLQEFVARYVPAETASEQLREPHAESGQTKEERESSAPGGQADAEFSVDSDLLAIANAGLSTPDIARLFDGLKSWDEERWIRRLGEVPEWTSKALVQRGARGRGAHRWNPLILAQCLLNTAEHQDAMRKKLRALFRDKPALQPWSEAWRSFESDLDWYGADKPGR